MWGMHKGLCLTLSPINLNGMTGCHRNVKRKDKSLPTVRRFRPKGGQLLMNIFWIGGIPARKGSGPAPEVTQSNACDLEKSFDFLSQGHHIYTPKGFTLYEGLWGCSSGVELLPFKQAVEGSNPSTLIKSF